MRKGKKLQAPYYASATATRNYIITRNLVPTNNKSIKLYLCYIKFIFLNSY